MFISRTRIVQIARGPSTSDPQLINNPPTLWTSATGVMIEALADAMALVPVVDRPDPAFWWRYVVEWELSAHLVADVLGVIPYTAGDAVRHLIVNADFWLTAAARLGGQSPLARNTFEFVYSRKPRDFGAHVEAIVYSWMLQAAFAGWIGDRRDPARMALAGTNPASDPDGILQNNRLRQIDGAAVTVLEWRR